MKKKLLVTLTFIIVSTILTSVLTPTPVSAGGTVGNGSPASCTEAALNSALVGGGLITFNCGPDPITFTFTTTKLVTEDTTIDGDNLITLSGGDTVFFFLVFPNISLTVKNLEMSNGRNTINAGGAIRNFGTTVLINTVVANNQAPGWTAGSIYNEGDLDISYSLFYNNGASGGIAGAIDNHGNLTVGNSTFFANYAYLHSGSISNYGTAVIYSTNFDSNHANAGGAIDNQGDLTIVDTTFGKNYATTGNGGAIYNEGNLIMDTSSFIGNKSGDSKMGGALYNVSPAVAVIKRSAFIENSAFGGMGGGIANSGQLTVSESQFAINQASGGLGGGLFSTGSYPLVITNSTISENSGYIGGGAYISGNPTTLVNNTFADNATDGIAVSSGIVSVKNTILAANSTHNCLGTLISEGYNLEDGTTCSFTQQNDLSNTNPNLGPRQDNGGPTWTHALLPGSPAINAGTNTGCPSTDQRGMGRPRFGICDIGAYEFGRVSFFPLVIK